MRQVDRATVPEPAKLRQKVKDKSEFDLAREYIEALEAKAADANGKASRRKPKAYPFSVYKDASVKAALESLFHGKCAYCESYFAGTQPVDVEHYRPKGAVEGIESHRGYWWLAMRWDNLLPSCIDCNRRRVQKISLPPEEQINAPGEPSRLGLAKLGAYRDLDRTQSAKVGKASVFPLSDEKTRAFQPDQEANEARLLLDPTRDNPDDHLIFAVDRRHPLSLVYPRPLAEPAAGSGVAGSAMGRMSIHYYGLNRLGLVQARTKLLRDLEFLLQMSINLSELGIRMKDRNTQKKREMAKAAPLASKAIQEEIDFNTRVERKIATYRDDALNQIRRMTLPDAQYSALAKAWVAAYLDDEKRAARKRRRPSDQLDLDDAGNRAHG